MEYFCNVSLKMSFGLQSHVIWKAVSDNIASLNEH